MSYNILYGAGVERQYDNALPADLIGKNRLPEILSVIKEANPDILGIQEANGWERGTPPVIEQVAKELGMNHFFARTAGGFHLGLLTKLRILETENLSSEVGRQGALRATLLSPAGEIMNVFLVHLDPASSEARTCQVEALLQRMQPYLRRPTILMGDMNFQQSSREYLRLEEAGWKLVAAEKSWGIDQIWIFPSIRWSTTFWFQSLTVPSGISDHNPIGAEINIYRSLAVAPTFTPSPPPPNVPISLFALNALTEAKTLRFDNLDSPCASSLWTSPWMTETFSNGMLDITGEESWQAFAYRHKEFSEGQGVTLRFQFTRGSEFEIFFDNNGWNSDQYRRFGMNVRGNAVQSIVRQGTALPHGENLTENPRLRFDTWYSLLLAIGKNGEFLVQVWDPADPAGAFKHRGRMGDKGSALPWIFRIASNKGRMFLDDLSEISFGEIR